MRHKKAFTPITTGIEGRNILIKTHQNE